MLGYFYNRKKGNPGFRTVAGYREMESAQFYSPNINKLQFTTQFPRPKEILPTLDKLTLKESQNILSSIHVNSYGAKSGQLQNETIFTKVPDY